MKLREFIKEKKAERIVHAMCKNVDKRTELFCELNESTDVRTTVKIIKKYNKLDLKFQKLDNKAKKLLDLSY